MTLRSHSKDQFDPGEKDSMAKRKARTGIRTAMAGTDYSVGELPEGTIRMDLNMNLLGPNPAVDKFMRSGKYQTHEYPTPDSDELREALAEEWHLEPGNIVCGNGVDDIIDLTIKAFTVRGDRIVFPSPSFSMYAFWAKVYGCIPVEVPMRPGFTVDVDGLLKEPAKLMLVARPNNPTGNMLPEEDMRKLIEGTKAMVALDEAYIEYSGGSFMDRLKDYPNLVVFRTFSKAYAIAGLRVGAAAATDGSKRLYEVKPPFNLNLISEKAAIVALRNRAWLKRTVSILLKEREKLASSLKGLGFQVYPSVTNFLLCKAPISSKALCTELAKRGILIKDHGNIPGLEDHVRITAGAPGHNRLFLDKVNDILDENRKGVRDG
jgi:histidinol-phosphate aminotransferase